MHIFGQKKKKPPCLKNGYAQSFKDMLAHKNRFRYNPLAKLFVPQPLRMSPGYPCCCGESCECVCSIFQDSEAPCCIKVTIAGMAEGTCGSCISLNKAYYLHQNAPNSCTWTHLFWAICGLSSITLTAYEDSGDYKIRIVLGAHVWEKNYGTTRPTCGNLNNGVLLSHQTDSGTCSSESATCFIESSPNNCNYYTECGSVVFAVPDIFSDNGTCPTDMCNDLGGQEYEVSLMRGIEGSAGCRTVDGRPYCWHCLGGAAGCEDYWQIIRINASSDYFPLQWEILRMLGSAYAEWKSPLIANLADLITESGIVFTNTRKREITCDIVENVPAITAYFSL